MILRDARRKGKTSETKRRKVEESVLQDRWKEEKGKEIDKKRQNQEGINPSVPNSLYVTLDKNTNNIVRKR